MEAASDPSRPAVPAAGRPRDAHLDAAILAAADAALADSGYRSLTWEELARRAGTTKPAIRRRWPSRQRLVLTALARRLGETSVPDTGCTICDLSEGIELFVAAFDRMPPDVLGPLLADCADDPVLRGEFMTMLFHPPRAAVEHILVRARASGALRADIDLELTLDFLGSLVHYRVVFGHASLSASEIERAVESLLQGLASDYPALLAHSREQAGDPKIHRRHAD